MGNGTKGAQGAHIITCTKSHRRSSLDRCRTGFLTFRVRDWELDRTGLRTLLVSELRECIVVVVAAAAAAVDDDDDDDDDKEEDDSKDWHDGDDSFVLCEEIVIAEAVVTVSPSSSSWPRWPW